MVVVNFFCLTVSLTWVVVLLDVRSHVVTAFTAHLSSFGSQGDAFGELFPMMDALFGPVRGKKVSNAEVLWMIEGFLAGKVVGGFFTRPDVAVDELPGEAHMQKKSTGEQ